jgi:hypothetical protein
MSSSSAPLRSKMQKKKNKSSLRTLVCLCRRATSPLPVLLHRTSQP